MNNTKAPALETKEGISPPTSSTTMSGAISVGKKLLGKMQEDFRKAHWVLTLNAPRRNRVGCKPIENISRNIVEAIRARMPWGLGRAITMARDISIAVHSKPDKWGSSVPRVERKEQNPFQYFM